MTYFPDLSDYTYHAAREPGTLNIGWLSKSDEPKYRRWGNQYDPIFCDALAMLCANQGALVQLCRGAHACDFCSETLHRNHVYANGEIRVTGLDGTIYAAPRLITHYVEQHQYRPPEVFVEAVKASVYGDVAIRTHIGTLPKPEDPDPPCRQCGRNDYFTNRSQNSNSRRRTCGFCAHVHEEVAADYQTHDYVCYHSVDVEPACRCSLKM